MTEFVIKRAQRSQTKLRLALTGASFAGKTTGALMLAKGLVNGMIASGELQARPYPYIGVIDTERRRSQFYSHLVPFDTIDLDPPYSIERYMAAQRAFENAGYPVIIIDSGSHAWAGAGGLLSTLKGDHNNSFAEWKNATPKQDGLVDGWMASPAHLIVTMRSKTEYVLEKQMTRQGKEITAPRRVGMKPIQRDGVEYEFTCLVDLQLTHDKKRRMIDIQKDNTGVLLESDLQTVEAWEQAGERMIVWMSEGAVPVDRPRAPSAAEQAEALCAAAERLMGAAATIPELERVFADHGRRLALLTGDLPADTTQELRRRFVAARNDRKAALAAPGTTAVAQNPITPDDTDAIDGLLAMGGISHAEFFTQFGVARIGALDVTQYDDAVTWIINTAGSAGIELKRPTRATEELRMPSALDKVRGVVDRIGNAKDDLISRTTH